ncbi:DUF1223 domain-containing protein [Hyphococcus flavus]|uniref:DUF1223 domain-containing protein n=1 Tax=Hyphococcus flavus TaxID=1866326 RepID=A0AAE9ZH34_9PROT|nr:DUF1223 domain-containing protein [Hyphococcus flavus]WDI32672.1 DUF1223 domain-containing protein [Hyphococcus flavus]
MTGIGLRFSIAAGFACIAAPAAAQDRPAEKTAPVVVEMFLSQACSSCTPAAKFLTEIADRDDVIALSWHVDYWDTLMTKDGRWADIYSDKAYTIRQKKYNMRLRSRSSIYTPQAIVNGAWETVGSSKEKLQDLIDDVSAQNAPALIDAGWDEDALSFTIGQSERGGNAYLISFMPRVSTAIPRGENAGRVFEEVNVVTNVRPLGVVLRHGGTITAPPPVEGEGCALIVQEAKQQKITAAAYCPSTNTTIN